MKHIAFAIALAAFTFTSCEQSQEPATVNEAGSIQAGSLARRGVADFQRVAKVMRANNLGQRAIFLEPTQSGYGIGLLKNVEFQCGPSGCFFTAGQIAFFSGSYGTGDFWRQNPNGTISVKLSTNRAEGFYADFTSPDFYFGTGHMNTKFTGTIEEFCFEDEGVTYCFSFLIEDPSANAWVLHGTAPVTLNGAGGDPRRLQMWLNVNPGGGWTNPRIDFKLN